MKPPISKPYDKMNRKERRKHLRWCNKNNIIDGAVIRAEVSKVAHSEEFEKYYNSLPKESQEFLTEMFKGNKTPQ